MEGLPNIESKSDDYHHICCWSGSSAVTEMGAMYTNGRTGWHGGGASGDFHILNFDASRSNAIYGNSNHVTPINCTMRIWKRIS